MLEPVGLRVDGVDRQPEGLGKVLLEQPVVADDLESDLRPGLRQLDATVRRVVGQAERGRGQDDAT